MDGVSVKLTADGSKNATLLVQGRVVSDFARTELFDCSDLKPKPNGVRLDSVLWAIQEKMLVVLFWGPNEADLMLPLESRGNFRFDTGMSSPKMSDGWDGKIWYEGKLILEPKYFLFTLDFDKQ